MLIDKMSFIRIVLLAVSLINQVLVVFGKSPLPFKDEELELALSSIFTVIMALWSAWKNNYLSSKGGLQKKALQAQGLYKK